jgi:small subunit ribosomal protein S1
VVKNITDYGAFVDLGGIDGLLHVTDIAWRRVNHPSEVLTIGQTVKVQIIRVNHETQRISLGMKQLMVRSVGRHRALKYPVNAKFTGRVTNITDYGAFVELEPGVEGLIHVSEMSWTKKNVHPGKIVSTSQEVDVMILEVDPSNEAPHLARPQADPGQPVGSLFLEKPIPSARSSRARSRTRPSSACSSASTAMSTAWCTCPTSTGTRPGEQVIEDYNKGDMVKAEGARRRCREGAHLARHQAARRRPLRRGWATHAQGRHRHLRRHEGEPTASR